MKSAQIFGLILFVLAFVYYRSIAHMLEPGESGGITAGLGVMYALSLCVASAICLIPATFKLWRKRVRIEARFLGWPWLGLLAVNSVLAIVYVVTGLRVALAMVWVVATH